MINKIELFFEIFNSFRYNTVSIFINHDHVMYWDENLDITKGFKMFNNYKICEIGIDNTLYDDYNIYYSETPRQ